MATLHKDIPRDKKYLEPVISQSHRQLLRQLASEVAEYASHAVNQMQKRQWSRIKDLHDDKPTAWVNGV